jgi:ribosomal protein S18
LEKKNNKKNMKPRRTVRPFKVQVPLPEVIDYKDFPTLRKFLSERGKLLSRHFTGANAIQQRFLAEAVKRARNLALLPVGSSKRK